MTFLNTRDALIPKTPFSFFLVEFWVRVTPRARGFSLGRILGIPSIEPFWGGGGDPTRRNMRREERVTVQGPVKEQQPDGMSHRGLPRGLYQRHPPPPPS